MSRTRIFGLRQRLAGRAARFVDWRVEHSDRLVEHGHQLGGHQQAVEWHEACLTDHLRRLDEADGRFADLEKVQRWTADELARLIPQVAAQETQLESLRELLASVPAASAPEVDEARALIGEIRREHEQIRVRLTGIAQFEDRLRTLESPSAS